MRFFRVNMLLVGGHLEVRLGAILAEMVRVIREGVDAEAVKAAKAVKAAVVAAAPIVVAHCTRMTTMLY